MSKKVFIGADHGGFALKVVIVEDLIKKGYDVEDLGCYSTDSTDYPMYAEKVCTKVLEENAFGILVCGTGIGMSMAANRIPGIRAALATNEFHARLTRQHNNANVLCLGERVTGPGVAVNLAELFLETEFEGGRHQRRIDQFDKA